MLLLTILPIFISTAAFVGAPHETVIPPRIIQELQHEAGQERADFSTSTVSGTNANQVPKRLAHQKGYDVLLDLYILTISYMFEDSLNEEGEEETLSEWCNCKDAKKKNTPCIASHGFEVENTCAKYHHPSQTTEGQFTEGSTMMWKLTEDEEEVCISDYRDTECLEASSYCYPKLPFDECHLGVVQGTVQRRDWCIHSSAPRGPFVVPMVRITTYYDLASCEAGVNASESLFPADNNFCLPNIVYEFDTPTKYSAVSGSFLASCENVTNTTGQEELQLKVQSFSDRNCSIPYKNNSIASSASYLPPSSCAPYYEFGAIFATADCNAAAIYCKPIEFSGATASTVWGVLVVFLLAALVLLDVASLGMYLK